MPVEKDAGLAPDRRHDQRHRRRRHARRTCRRRHAARPDRPDGQRSAADTRTDPAAGGSTRRILRPGGRRRLDSCVHRVGDLGTGAAPRAGAAERRRRADHRLPVRARARHPHGHHGRHGPRCVARRADQERRSARAAGVGRHARGGQDRHADRGPAAARAHHGRGAVHRGGGAATGGRARAGQRAPARVCHRRRRARARDRPGHGARRSNR